MNPGYSTELRTLRDLVPKERWDEFRAAFSVDVMSSPTATQGLNRLRSFEAFDEPGLRTMMSKFEQDAAETYLRRRAVFESSPVRKIIEKEMTEGERFVAMAKQGTAGEVADAVAKGGEAYAIRARAGVYQDILTSATKTTEQGVTVLDANALIGAVERWKATGKLNSLFGEGDWRRIELLQKYAAPIAETADIGGGMMAGGLRQKALAALPDVVAGQAGKVAGRLLRPLLSNDIAAMVLSRRASYGRLLPASQNARQLSESMGLALYQLERGLDRGNVRPP
jgi:hypothetical protein